MRAAPKSIVLLHGFWVTPRSWEHWITRLRESGEERIAAVSRMSPADLSRPLADALLSQVQPTIGHHLNTMIYHEGYHGGQLAAWRRNHQLPPASWTFAPTSA